MKKLLLLAAVVLVAFSCEKSERHRGDELYMYSQEFTVFEQDWEEAGSGRDVLYYYCTFRMDRLTRRVCEIGEVSVTRFTDDGQTQLPETIYYSDGWSENITFDYTPGEITFKFASSNFDRIPDEMTFRVVLNY